jgi:hypothetical protein
MSIPRDTEILEQLLVLLTAMKTALDTANGLLDDIKTNTTT